jgi:LmbE family N-acetylglucosaminyl deacetylase
METNRTALERAFELARSGKVFTVDELRRKLGSEGYMASQIDGRALSRQLRELIRESRLNAEAATAEGQKPS